MKKNHYFKRLPISSLCLLSLALTACTSPQPAPVNSRAPARSGDYGNVYTPPTSSVYPNTGYPNTSYPVANTPAASYPIGSNYPANSYPADNRPIYPAANVPVSPPSNYGSNPQVAVPNLNEPVPAGYHRAMVGDTIYKIGRQYNVAPRDLLQWNNLENPNQLNLYQLIRISPIYSSTALAKPNNTVANNSGNNNLSNNVNVNTGSNVASTSTEMVWPIKNGRLLKKFDQKGIDLGGKTGDPVLASASGKVIFANPMRGYGNLVVINHGNQIVTAYANLQHIAVKDQQTVKQGQMIGILAGAGIDGGKMQFQVRKNSEPVDPLPYLVQK